jgi:nitrogen fixation protein NifU and related proteins
VTDARELYKAQVLEHAHAPKNEGELADRTHHHRGTNPLCGDRIDVDLKLEGEHIAAIRFRARGCAIAVASGSIMTELVQGKTAAEARRLSARLEALLAPGNTESDAALDILLGVRRFRGRTQCATLAFTTLCEAIGSGGGAA